MNKIFAFFFILLNIISCSSVPKGANLIKTLDHSEAISSVGGKRILEASRSMIDNKEIIVGGCWDYINTVYDRAGYPANLRLTIYKSKFQGPYLNASQVKTGDWLYFVNHSFRDIEHSAIFVAWTDEAKKIALMVSYEGRNKKKPALYKTYKLNSIYNVIRALD